MTEAIINNSPKWLEQTAKTYAGVDALDIVVGITYGTDRTTNNKENQILAKLIGSGFEEEDRQRKPGILINAAGNVRVYRRIGADFWSFIGDPVRPHRAEFVFLEVLLALAKALSVGVGNADLATRINLRTLALGHALSKVLIPSGGVPEWMGTEFKDEELSWFMNSLSAFYDKGI